MATSSSSSARSASRRSVYGIPNKCWCGKGLTVWGSETKDNPSRRFYRCDVALQRKSEAHLFKWEDEAILDEVRMVDAKVENLVHDFHALSKKVIDQLNSNKSFLDSLEFEMMSKLNQHTIKMAQDFDAATRQLKEDINTTKLLGSVNNVVGCKFAAAVAIVGVVACLYCKLV